MERMEQVCVVGDTQGRSVLCRGMWGAWWNGWGVSGLQRGRWEHWRGKDRVLGSTEDCLSQRHVPRLQRASSLWLINCINAEGYLL